MILDGRRLDEGTRLGADVCVVGAGPAGITLARRLAERGVEVVVVESGGMDPDPRTTRLNEGRSLGEPVHFASGVPGLEHLRVRALGGTSRHWGGWCLPLEPGDLEQRDWVPSSGWPFGWDELAPHYEDAQVLCELGPFRYDGPWWAERTGSVAVLDTPSWATRVFQLSTTEFGSRYRSDLEGTAGLTVVSWANVVDLPLAGDRVARVELAVLDGPRLTVEAGAVVLAVGGLEVPRLLLACRSDRPEGLGNARDLVGRHFADHPHLDVSAVFALDEDDLDLYPLARRPEVPREGPPVDPAADDPPPDLLTVGALTLDPAVARSVGVAGLGAVVNVHGGLDDDGTELPAAVVGDALAATLGRRPGYVGVLNLRLEPRPEPSSRVRLGRGRDELGMPRIEVDWRLAEADRRGLARAVELLADEWGAAGLGLVRTTHRGETAVARRLDVGAHHMGTARMHDDPARGVVDRHGRVHDVENLYVAGSATFPSYGWANPTLTVVALALRLGDHLASVVGS